MTIMQIFLLPLVVFLVSFGQIFFKVSANRINIDGTFFNWVDMWMVLGLGAYGISLFLWLIVIKNIPLSLATPISGLTYVLIPILCAIFFNEKLSIQYFAGSLLILLGIFITSRN